jgi:N-formylmaleamate deformylase
MRIQMQFAVALYSMLCVLDTVAEIRPFEVETSGEGRAIYLIPGLASPGSVWDDLAAHLREQGYQTRVITLAGFAGQPPISGERFLPVVRDALAAEIGMQEGDEPVVIGHSLGGFMAFWLAATVPDALAGVVAIDGIPYLGALSDASITPESLQAQAEQIATFMASLTPEQFAAQNRLSLSTMISDADRVEEIATTSSLSDPATVGRAVAEMMTTDLRPLMADVRIPVVLIQAADSGALESMRQAYAGQVELIEKIHHVVARKGRHFVQLDDPDFVAEEIDRLLGEIRRD